MTSTQTLKTLCFTSLFFALSALGATPLQEPAHQVHGFYSDGKLNGATRMADEGMGYFKLFRDRDRAWGSQGMVELLSSASSAVNARFPTGERLQIGDIAARKGGQITRHASHQNGLDADIVYFRMNHHEQNLDEKEGFVESFVIENARGERVLSDNFDLELNWALLDALYRSGRLNRIFTDPVIKLNLCNYALQKPGLENHDEILRHLRPYAGHDDHMHVRLTCPKQSPECTPQTPEVPPGSGCDSIDAAALEAWDLP